MYLMPTTGTITWRSDITSSGEKKFIRITVAIGDEFVNVTAFGAVAEYIAKNNVIGKRIFLEVWQVRKRQKESNIYYDFSINKCVIERGE